MDVCGWVQDLDVPLEMLKIHFIPHNPWTPVCQDPQA